MQELLNSLSEAVAAQNWIVVVVVSVLVLLTLAALILKALGRDVPILGTIIDLGRGVVQFLPKKAPPAPVDPSKQGVAGVVEVKDESNK
jgi:hypothetical protein